MLVRIIDSNGFFVEDAFVDELTEFTIETPCPDGFYLPRWDGTQWVEVRTQAEIDAIRASQTVQPTIEERVNAVETDVDEIVTVLATIEGVTV